MNQQKFVINDCQVAAENIRVWIQVSSPATTEHNGTLATKFPGHPYMKYLFTPAARRGRDLQAVFKKQYFLKKRNYLQERIPPHLH